MSSSVFPRSRFGAGSVVVDCAFAGSVEGVAVGAAGAAASAFGAPNRLGMAPAAGVVLAGSAGFAPNNPPPPVVAAASAGLLVVIVFAAPKFPKLKPPVLGASAFFSPSFCSAGFAPKLPNESPPAFGASAAGVAFSASLPLPFSVDVAGVVEPLPPRFPKEKPPVLAGSGAVVEVGVAEAGLSVDAGVVDPKEPKENPPDLGGSAAAAADCADER